MQAGERQFHLGLDRDDTRHPATGRLRGQVLKQRRLARARAAAHNQGAALTGANGLEQRAERGALCATTDELRGVPAPGRGGFVHGTDAI
jgi:hypothetical protein